MRVTYHSGRQTAEGIKLTSGQPRQILNGGQHFRSRHLDFALVSYWPELEGGGPLKIVVTSAASRGGTSGLFLARLHHCV